MVGVVGRWLRIGDRGGCKMEDNDGGRTEQHPTEFSIPKSNKIDIFLHVCRNSDTILSIPHAQTGQNNTHIILYGATLRDKSHNYNMLKVTIDSGQSRTSSTIITKEDRKECLKTKRQQSDDKKSRRGG